MIGLVKNIKRINMHNGKFYKSDDISTSRNIKKIETFSNDYDLFVDVIWIILSSGCYGAKIKSFGSILTKSCSHPLIYFILMRKLLAILAIVLVAQAITDKEILQQTLNGLFEENKLPDPTTIVPCIDDATAHKIVVFAGEVLDKAAKGSPTDLVQLVNLIKGFGDQIPQSVKDCLNGNKEFETLGLKYGVDNNTDSSVIEKKVITYVTLHYLEVHKWLGDLNNNWKGGKYYQTGFDAGTYGHKVLSMVGEPNLTDKEILQQTLNGLFEENKLPDPTTIVPCIDDATAKKIVAFIGEVLDKAAKGSPADLVQLVNLIKGFGDQIPQSVKDCLNGNAEFHNLGLKYGITDTTDSSVIEKKVIAYVTLHYLEVHKWLGDLNNNWKGGKYYQTGFDAGTYGHKVLGITLSYIAKLRSEI